MLVCFVVSANGVAVAWLWLKKMCRQMIISSLIILFYKLCTLKIKSNFHRMYFLFNRVEATTLPGSWLQRCMACGKNNVLYTVVLVCGTRNRSEWPLVRREVRWGGVPLVYQHYDSWYHTQELQCTGHYSSHKPYTSATNYLEVWWLQLIMFLEL
jgi:hypothetical protein